MFVLLGAKHSGVIEDAGVSCIATELFTVFWITLFPIGTVAIVPLPDGKIARVPLGKLRWRSLLLAWAQWLIPTMVVLSALSLVGDEGLWPTLIACALASGAGALLSYFILRGARFAPAGVGVRRSLRSRWLGAPVEVDWGLFAQDLIEQNLQAFLTERERPERSSYQYRGTPSIEHCERMALAPAMTDGEYLVAAAVYVELQEKKGAYGATAIAERIWQKLFALYPDVVHTAPSFPAFYPANVALFYTSTTPRPTILH